MNNNKQTAVEWLMEQLKDNEYSRKDGICRIHIPEYILTGIVEQAKAMHKQEMIEFAQEVFRNRYNQVHQSLSHISDDIYNEKYGKDNADNSDI